MNDHIEKWIELKATPRRPPQKRGWLDPADEEYRDLCCQSSVLPLQ